MKKFITLTFVKIAIAATIAIVLLGGCFALAMSIPTPTERLIRFNEELIKQYQTEWSELNKDRGYLQTKVDELTNKMEFVEKNADMARMTIDVMNGNPVGVDFK